MVKFLGQYKNLLTHTSMLFGTMSIREVPSSIVYVPSVKLWNFYNDCLPCCGISRLP